MSLPQLARDSLNHWLRRRGYALNWSPPRVSALGMALDVNFEMLAAHLMLRTPEPFFVGIGANDGVTHDPLYPFIRDHGWRGVMVEPIPEAFAALERNYAGLPRVELVHAAIGNSDTTGTIYAAEVTDDTSLRMSLHASFDRSVLLKARRWYPDIESRIVEREVSIMRFDTLIARLGNPGIDVLKMDTEGHDLEILRTIDLQEVRPALVLVERANLSREDQIRLADILLGAGYRVALTNLDMLGYRPGP